MKRGYDSGTSRRDFTKKPRHAQGQYMNQTYGYPMGMPGMGMDMNMGMGMGMPGMGMGMNMPPGDPNAMNNGGMGMDPHMMGQSYNPAAMMGHYGNPMMPTQSSNDRQFQTSNTIYVGDLPPNIKPNDILRNVKTGNVESLRILDAKKCAFISFFNIGSAIALFDRAQRQGFVVRNQPVRIQYANNSKIPASSISAYQNGATRTVFIGNLDSSHTEEEIRNAVEDYGQVERIDHVGLKNIAFVHFCNVAAAVKCVQEMPQQPAWTNCRVNFGKDPCAPKGGEMTNMPLEGGMDYMGQGYGGYPSAAGAMAPGGDMMGVPAQYNPMMTMGASANRTVFVSNIVNEATLEDICDVIRGGLVQRIKYLRDRNIAFVTFIDPICANQLLEWNNSHGVVLKGRRLRMSWSRPSSVPPNIMAAVQQGASRNVYLGQLDESFTVDRLRADLSHFGEIELVNIIADKKCGFVNFADIQSAIKAVGEIGRLPGYANVRVNYGKDRCANAFRVFQGGRNGHRGGNGASGGRGESHHHHNNSTHEDDHHPVSEESRPIIEHDNEIREPNEPE
ncbi:hypothetical protein IWQ61_002055 [Dispira simplex]|nr:hypothetical protein IWQ61_002055 [Dispira simplex]